MGIELVVFDIAGTTVTDKGEIHDLFKKAFAGNAVTVAETDIQEVRGYRKRDAIQLIIARCLPGEDGTDEIADRIYEGFTKQVVAFYETCEGLYPLPFAEKVFIELQNNKIKVTLNTGFSRNIATPILKRLGWETAPFIDAVICSDEVPEGRPHPYMIERLMQQLNVNYTEKVAKVGDTKVDIEEGQNAGCGIVIAVTTGACTKEQLIKHRPDHIIDSLQFLPSLIL